MGRSEWVFLIKDQNMLNGIIDLVNEHNRRSEQEDDMGEELHMGCIIRRTTDGGRVEYYLCVGNGGGRDYTSKFIKENYKGVVFYPFAKPSWWMDCQDYVWKWSKEDPTPVFPTFD